MLTVYGEGRGFRVVWLLEELRLPYCLRPVDMGSPGKDAEFAVINPAGFIPALQDGDTTLVESIAILQYLLARHGPSPLAMARDEPGFAPYLQFLLMGEAGLGVPINTVFRGRNLAPEAERDAQVTNWAMKTFTSRLGLVVCQLERTPHLAGGRFTAADISVAYALLVGLRTKNYLPGPVDREYLVRVTKRPAYLRAMEQCTATKAWADRSPAL
ncbi:MAG TPA: glutathione S-transferase family protein [Novosphingobium sp.]